jgi:hypothetical protein
MALISAPVPGCSPCVSERRREESVGPLLGESAGVGEHHVDLGIEHLQAGQLVGEPGPGGVLQLVQAGVPSLHDHGGDFARFVSPALSILMFAVPFVVFGLIEAWFAERTPAGPSRPPANRAIALSGYGVLGALFVYGGVRLTQSVIQILAMLASAGEWNQRGSIVRMVSPSGQPPPHARFTGLAGHGS